MNTTLALDSLSPVARAKLLDELQRWRDEVFAVTETVFLYAIQAGGESGPVKIGTAKDPDARLKTLQTGNPEPLAGIAAWRALPYEERALHERFAEHRIRGEWFRPAPEVLETLWAMDAPWWWEADECPE